VLSSTSGAGGAGGAGGSVESAINIPQLSIISYLDYFIVLRAVNFFGHFDKLINIMLAKAHRKLFGIENT